MGLRFRNLDLVDGSGAPPEAINGKSHCGHVAILAGCERSVQSELSVSQRDRTINCPTGALLVEIKRRTRRLRQCENVGGASSVGHLVICTPRTFANILRLVRPVPNTGLVPVTGGLPIYWTASRSHMKVP